jgi:hypothetical protein
MLKIPSQAYLVIAVLSYVAVVSLVPTGGGGDSPPGKSSLEQGYDAPAVSPTGNQTGFLKLLKLDRANVIHFGINPTSGSYACVAASIQSYNAIAGQMSLSTLEKSGLPQMLK